jgi:hypothetical protein
VQPAQPVDDGGKLARRGALEEVVAAHSPRQRLSPRDVHMATVSFTLALSQSAILSTPVR